ncbi:MAG: hypothetical protein U9R74_01355 [Pseudomonadota bacterium]|nr:hypothetical protein [Pseudomonadota bacterium]
MENFNPFPGLRPFEASESHLFFGRENATDELLRKLRENRFIAVVGTSGSGKSSLVKAGMLPDLYGGYMVGAGSSWRVAIMRPGDAPIRALAKALSAPDLFGNEDGDPEMRRAITETVLRHGAMGLIDVTRQARMAPGENFLVIVDQFEELFRINPTSGRRGTEDEAAAFVKLLLEAVNQSDLPIYVMLTMRSEYLGDCTRFRGLPEAINAGQYLIPRMTRDQRRKAITGPIAVGGATITPPLVQRLLNDIGDNPDQLPIMQHAMMRTYSIWEAGHNQDTPIDLVHYEATGGMDEALSRHADEAYEALPDKQSRAIAEKIFKRLTGRGSDNREMRNPATVSDLCATAGAARENVLPVIDAFRQEGRSFLMPSPGVLLSDDSVVDISHESLIRIWKRLGKWVDEETQSARTYSRVAETADLHKQGAAGLWRNPDLQIALNWRQQARPNAAWAERYEPGFDEAMTFLDASRAACRRRTFLRISLPILAVAALVAFPYVRMFERLADIDDALAAAIEQQSEADEQAAIAQQKLMQTKADLELTQISINRAQQFLQRLKSQEEAAKQKNQIAQARVQEEIETLTRELQDLAVSGGDRTKQKEIQIALAAAQAEARLLEQLGEGQEERESAANDVAAGVENLEEVERKLAQSVEELDVVTSTDAFPVEATNPAGPGEADLSEFAGLEGSLPATEVPEGRRAGDQLRVAAARDTSAQSTAELLFPDSVESAVECISAEQAGDDVTVTEKLALWKTCRQVGNQSEKAAAEKRLRPLEALVVRDATVRNSDKNFLTCADVKRLECRGEASAFKPGKIYVYARINAPREETLVLKWLKGGKEFRISNLKVKENTGRGFRTFTWKTLSEPGPYRIRLYNSGDALIASRALSVR